MRSSAVLPGHQRGHGDRAGIDHGVERPVGDLVEHDGIKGLAGGLDADMTQHIVAPVMLKRVAVHEGLRHRLNGEPMLGITCCGDFAVDCGKRDAEDGGIHLAELGDIVGDLTGVDA